MKLHKSEVIFLYKQQKFHGIEIKKQLVEPIKYYLKYNLFFSVDHLSKCGNYPEYEVQKWFEKKRQSVGQSLHFEKVNQSNKKFSSYSIKS